MKRTKVRKTYRRSQHKFTGPLGVNTKAKNMLGPNWVTGKWWVSGQRPQDSVVYVSGEVDSAAHARDSSESLERRRPRCSSRVLHQEKKE